MLKKMTMTLAAMLFSGSAFAWTIRWDADNYRAGGNDCKKDNTVFAIAAGEEISFIMTALGTNLSGFSGGKLEERKFCTLMIPATVKQGLYLAKLTHRVLGGFLRTGNAEGKISVSSTFYNNPVSPISFSTNSYRNNSVPFFEKKASTNFRVNPRYCQSDYRGIMRSSIAVTGQRKSINDGIVIQADGYDVKFETTAQIFKCPGF
ncbi:MAG: hypothetical protein H6618_04765 [Deltaproteobacteria bacterium]|nr:hypothetical protein [Deltaproteobacteria bacterium]